MARGKGKGECGKKLKNKKKITQKQQYPNAFSPICIQFVPIQNQSICDTLSCSYKTYKVLHLNAIQFAHTKNKKKNPSKTKKE